MFRKTNNKKQEAPLLAATVKKNAVPSVFSSDLNVLGTIVSEGAVDFSGTMDGNIRCQTLTVRADGKISGEIHAESVHVYGLIKGIIRARDVHLFSTCHIEGIIMHESLSIEDGAFIDGSCKRTDRINTSESGELLPQDSNTVEILENLRLLSA
jgi:cytoskeletal protein CcmA (bactofilin family)